MLWYQLNPAYMSGVFCWRFSQLCQFLYGDQNFRQYLSTDTSDLRVRNHFLVHTLCIILCTLSLLWRRIIHFLINMTHCDRVGQALTRSWACAMCISPLQVMKKHIYKHPKFHDLFPPTIYALVIVWPIFIFLLFRMHRLQFPAFIGLQVFAEILLYPLRDVVLLAHNEGHQKWAAGGKFGKGAYSHSFPCSSLLDWSCGLFVGQPPELFGTVHPCIHHRYHASCEIDADCILRYDKSSPVDFWLRFNPDALISNVLGVHNVKVLWAQRKDLGTKPFQMYASAMVFSYAVIIFSLVCQPQVAWTFIIFHLFEYNLKINVSTWVQHTFSEDSTPYNATTLPECDDDKSNHVFHHVYPAAMDHNHIEGELFVSSSFGKQVQRWISDHDIIVLRGFNNKQLFMHLMNGNFTALTRAYVRNPAIPRTDREVMEMLKQRSQPKLF